MRQAARAIAKQIVGAINGCSRPCKERACLTGERKLDAVDAEVEGTGSIRPPANLCCQCDKQRCLPLAADLFDESLHSARTSTGSR